MALGAIALASLGVPAVSLSGWQVPVGTDGTHGGANVRSVGAERIRQELAQRRVVHSLLKTKNPDDDTPYVDRGGPRIIKIK